MGRRPLCLVCLLLMLVMCLADWIGFPLLRGNSLSESAQTWIASHPEVMIFGEVYQCQNTENSHSIYLKNNNLKEVALASLSEKSIENIRVFLKEKEEVPIGAFVCVSGKLEEIGGTRNPGEFDARQYYACQHVSCFMKEGVIEKIEVKDVGYRQWLAELRKKFVSVFKRIAGEDSPVFEAMLLGEKGDLDETLKVRYQMSGIVHILSISGTHISILGMGLFAVLKFVGAGNILAGLISVFFMLQYGLLTGGSVSAMRAVCMFALSVGAKILGRSYDMLTVLAFSAIVLLLDAPAYLYSSGFLLSFGAIAGLGIGAPILYEVLDVKRSLGKMFWSSVAVQMVTLPVILWSYGEISVFGIFLNLLVLPTVSVILGSGAAGCLLGMLWTDGGRIAVLPGRTLLGVYEKLCQISGKLPFGTWVAGQPKHGHTLAYYVFLICWFGIWYWYKSVRGKMSYIAKKRRKCVVYLCVSVLGVIFPILMGCLLLGYHPQNGLKITALDVGQGMAMVLKMPRNHHVMIDGGSSNKSKVGQYQILPYLKSCGISRLDAIVVTHTDSDHISGIKEILELQKEKLTSVKVDRLILPDWEEKPDSYLEICRLARDSGTEIILADTGDYLLFGETRLRFLSGKNENVLDFNENGLVIEVEYKEFQGLFTGDIGMETEEELLDAFRQVDYLQVAHHGSRHSSGELFLQKTQPKVGVISCSDSNTYGHPSPDTIRRLENAGCQVEYTMKNGAVTVWTDGLHFNVEHWVKEEKSEKRNR